MQVEILLTLTLPMARIIRLVNTCPEGPLGSSGGWKLVNIFRVCQFNWWAHFLYGCEITR